jgi:hypothetical protein
MLGALVGYVTVTAAKNPVAQAAQPGHRDFVACALASGPFNNIPNFECAIGLARFYLSRRATIIQATVTAPAMLTA